MQAAISDVVLGHVWGRCPGSKGIQTARAFQLACGPRRLLTSANVYRKPAIGEWNSLDSTKKASSNKPSAPQRAPPPPHCAQYTAGKLAFLGDGIWTVSPDPQAQVKLKMNTLLPAARPKYINFVSCNILSFSRSSSTTKFASSHNVPAEP